MRILHGTELKIDVNFISIHSLDIGDYSMQNDFTDETKLRLTRRTFLGKTVRGIGSVALASLLTPSITNAG